MISFYLDRYKVQKVDEAAYKDNLTFREVRGRGADGKRMYAFFEMLSPLSHSLSPVSRYWSPAEAYAVLKRCGDFSHIKQEGTHRENNSPFK